MKRKNQNPREYSLRHCQERAQERYGFALSHVHYDELSRRIGEHFAAPGAPKFTVVNIEGSQYTLIVPLGKRKLVAVYDAESALLKTLLPPEQFSAHLN